MATSWSETLELFGGSSSLPSTQVFTYDPSIDKNFPAVEFAGTETNAVYTEAREIAGDFWIVQNAQFNGTNWIPQNAALPVYATVYRSPANVSFPGYMQRLTCAAGTNPVVWTTLFQIDNAGNIAFSSSLVREQCGTLTGQLIDGSTNSVTYPSLFAFATSTDQVFLSISSMSDSTALPGTPIILSKTTNGFSFAIPGGNTGDTATVDYLAYGH